VVRYDRYIKGAYNHRLEHIPPAKQKILDALRENYPIGLSVLELAKFEPDINPKTAYALCKALAKDHFIIAKKEKVAMKRSPNYPAERYYFEDYNYFYNEKEGFSHPFAPGYVQYDDSFLVNYEKARHNDLEGQISYLLTQILRNNIRSLKETHSHQQCKFCGYDHEMRDFMRATLLHLIDELEANIQFIEFMQREGIINEIAYEQLKSELRRTTLKVNEQKETAQKELMKEQRSTRSMENEEQTARYVTPHKQYKRGPHTEEWKLRAKKLNKDRWRKKTEHEKQKFIESVRKYPVDDHAFDMPLSADAKYWIGYTMGCASIGNDTRIRFEKSRQDRNHLERFKEFIDSHRPVRDIKDTNRCALEFSSPIIRNKLKEYGIHNNMKHNQKVSIFEDNRDFWRGFIDGNGKPKFSKKGSLISLRVKKGGRELILQFKTFSEKILGRSIGEPKLEVKKWSLALTDREAAELYGKLLYDKNSLALDRNLEWMKQILSLSEYKTKS
jgi:hypothetical protein